MLCDFCSNETSEANKVCHICGADTALSKSGLMPELYTNQRKLIDISTQKYYNQQVYGKWYTFILSTLVIAFLLYGKGDLPKSIPYTLFISGSISICLIVIMIMIANSLLNSLSLALIKAVHGHDPFVEPKRVGDEIYNRYNIDKINDVDTARKVNQQILEAIKHFNK